VFTLTRARMNCHAGCFVDDDQIVIFVQNLQRNRFRLRFDLFRWWFCDFDFVSGSDRLVRSRRCATDTNKAGAD
jgi:hypothetical protein